MKENKKVRRLCWQIAAIVAVIVLLLPSVSGCKDILVVGDATDGEANYLLKVRDPSRPGFQVLTMIPKNYNYNFYHPWTGRLWPMSFSFDAIGIASENDTIPNIVKAGMMLSSAGLGFGDSDTNSGWVNPRPFGWDDFDWIRFAAQSAASLESAALLLGDEAVGRLHAPSVSENMFVVGSDGGFVLEGDMLRFETNVIEDGFLLAHNYPKALWKTQWLRLRPIAKSWNVSFVATVEKNEKLSLGSFYGVRIVDVVEDGVFIESVPRSYMEAWRIEEPVFVPVGEWGSLGMFALFCESVEGSVAEVILSTEPFAWEQKISGYLESWYGNIGLSELMWLTRLNQSSLFGLRGMCELDYPFEASSIFAIPSRYPEVLSGGWFAPSHACGSVFVPFHICNTEIVDEFESGYAARLAQNVSRKLGWSAAEAISDVEDSFIGSEQIACDIAEVMLDLGLSVDEFMTSVDCSLQHEGLLVLELLWRYGEIDGVCEAISELYSLDSVVELRLFGLLCEKNGECLTCSENFSNLVLARERSIRYLEGFCEYLQ